MNPSAGRCRLNCGHHTGYRRGRRRARICDLSARAPESRLDKRPILSDLPENHELEQEADLVLLVFRDDYYTHERSERPGMAEITVAKNRHGPTGTAELRFRLGFGRLNHQRIRHGPAHCRRVEAVIHKALGDVFGGDSDRSKLSRIHHELVGDSSIASFEQNRLMAFQTFCHVVCV